MFGKANRKQLYFLERIAKLATLNVLAHEI
jgi:hypothetical protein